MNIKSATNSSVNVLELKDQSNNPTPSVKNPTLQQKLLENKQISDSHRQEWIIGSGVSQAITQLNLNSSSDTEEIASLINWNYYGGTAGWYVQSIDLLTGQFRRFGQFKPNSALTFPNSAKPLKYLTFPKGDGRSKDDLIILHKCWIQEWGEIERVFGKRQAGELKAFITRQKDTFRQPYGMTALECPRRSIIVGSVNDSQFLVDPTGNRRYCVIPISVKRINIKQLKQERDRIWAAAVKAYHQGEQWWLTDDEEKLSAANNQQFQIVDEWESAISHYLESRTIVSITEILTSVFDYELGKIDRSSQMRVGTILTNIGWKKVGRKQHQGKRQIVWQSGIPEKIAQGMSEVCQPETVTNQELDIPGIPGIPNEKVILKSNQNSNQISNSKLEPSEDKGMAVCQSISGQGIEPDTPADTPPQQAAIPWHDYPYNGDKQAKKQRANKVRERILNCQTNNDLIKLLSNGQVSLIEIDWLRKNLLTKTEINYLESVEATRQGNLFNESDCSTVSTQPTLEKNWDEVIQEIDLEMKRINWSVEIAQNYLQKTYGVKSRLHLNDEMILEFLEYLCSQPTPSVM